MAKIDLPGGEVIYFPDDLSRGQIEAEIRKHFPEPRPEALDPGGTLKRRNGTRVTHDEQLGRYFVYGTDGKLCALRNTLDEALDLADGLQPPPPPRHIAQSPEPHRADEPLPAHYWHHEAERLIRRDQANQRREQIEKMKRRRFVNRGTVPY